MIGLPVFQLHRWASIVLGARGCFIGSYCFCGLGDVAQNLAKSIYPAKT